MSDPDELTEDPFVAAPDDTPRRTNTTPWLVYVMKPAATIHARDKAHAEQIARKHFGRDVARVQRSARMQHSMPVKRSGSVRALARSSASSLRSDRSPVCDR